MFEEYAKDNSYMGIRYAKLFEAAKFCMWMSYLAICLPCRIKKRPIDGRSANERMVGQSLKCQMSGLNYLTLPGKSRYAPGALRPGFMSILVLQSSSLSSWCHVMVVWLLLAVSWVCLRFVIVVCSDHTHLLFLTKLLA